MIKADEKVLIVVDQFEELFRYSTLGARADAVMSPAARFVDYMVNAVSQTSCKYFYNSNNALRFYWRMCTLPGTYSTDQ